MRINFKCNFGYFQVDVVAVEESGLLTHTLLGCCLGLHSWFELGQCV